MQQIKIERNLSDTPAVVVVAVEGMGEERLLEEKEDLTRAMITRGRHRQPDLDPRQDRGQGQGQELLEAGIGTGVGTASLRRHPIPLQSRGGG